MKFTLVPNVKDFYLGHDSTITTSVKFEQAGLYINRSKLTLPVVKAHNLALTRETVKYPILRSNVESFIICFTEYKYWKFNFRTNSYKNVSCYGR